MSSCQNLECANWKRKSLQHCRLHCSTHYPTQSEQLPGFSVCSPKVEISTSSSSAAGQDWECPATWLLQLHKVSVQSRCQTSHRLIWLPVVKLFIAVELIHLIQLPLMAEMAAVSKPAACRGECWAGQQQLAAASAVASTADWTLQTLHCTWNVWDLLSSLSPAEDFSCSSCCYKQH